MRRFRFLWLKLTVYFATKLNYFRSKFLWKIVLGNSCKFDAKTIFYKHRNSQIKIGSGNTFLSRPNGLNLIGINRVSIIATKAEGANISIGDNCGFSGSSITSFLSIEIGNKVMFGANTFVTDSDWHPEDSRSGPPKQVRIHDNVWLGLNVVVLKGVSIGENTIVGANSVVTKSLPANVVAAGNPCRVIKQI